MAEKMDVQGAAGQSTGAPATERKRAKDRVMQLSEIRRGLAHQLVAQYGTPDDPIYVMQVCVDGVVFQGVGPSKKRAKSMAAEQALVYIGELDPSEVDTPQMEVASPDDYASDAFCGQLFYNFEAPHVSATDGQLKLPKYDEVSDYGMYFEEAETQEELDPFHTHIGRNAVAILSELHPEATFRVVYESKHTNPARFVQTVKVNFQMYRGEGSSKKVAKGRAAGEALMDIYGINFQLSEDGMPIYQGAEDVWERHKAQVLKQSVMNIAPIMTKGPIEQLNELFPDITKYEYPEDEKKRNTFFKCRVIVGEDTYEAIGLSKKDAKMNAAANAIDGLQANGLFDKRMKEMEAKRQEREGKAKQIEGMDPNKGIQLKFDRKGLALGAKNAIARLNELMPGLDYKIIGQTPLRNTCLTAFAVAVNVKGRNFVGIGKNKKLAKLESAEKAMKALGYWTEEDEFIKVQSLLGSEAAHASGWGPMGVPRLMGGPGMGMAGRGMGRPGMGMAGRGMGGSGMGMAGRGMGGSGMGMAGRGMGGSEMGVAGRGMGGMRGRGMTANVKKLGFGGIGDMPGSGVGFGAANTKSGVPGLFDDLGLDAEYGGETFGTSMEVIEPLGAPPRIGVVRQGGAAGGGTFADDSMWESGYSSDLYGLASGELGAAGYVEGQEEYEGGYGAESLGTGAGGEGEGLDSMINDLGSILASIMEANPGVGMADVWQMLQDNTAYKSWQGGDSSGFTALGEQMGLKMPQSTKATKAPSLMSKPVPLPLSAKSRNYSSMMSGGGSGVTPLSSIDSSPFWSRGAGTGTGTRARGAASRGGMLSSRGSSFGKSAGFGGVQSLTESDWTESDWADWSMPSNQGFGQGFGGSRGRASLRGVRRGMF